MGVSFLHRLRRGFYAINQMMANRVNFTLPMKSHGYLLEIIAGYKPIGTAVAVQNPEQNRPLASNKMNAIKGALEWGKTING